MKKVRIAKISAWKVLLKKSHPCNASRLVDTHPCLFRPSVLTSARPPPRGGEEHAASYENVSDRRAESGFLLRSLFRSRRIP